MIQAELNSMKWNFSLFLAGLQQLRIILADGEERRKKARLQLAESTLHKKELGPSRPWRFFHGHLKPLGSFCQTDPGKLISCSLSEKARLSNTKTGESHLCSEALWPLAGDFLADPTGGPTPQMAGLLVVPHLLGQADGISSEFRAQLRVEVRSRGDFHHFLVPSLDGTVPLIQMQYIPMLVTCQGETGPKMKLGQGGGSFPLWGGTSQLC